MTKSTKTVLIVLAAAVTIVCVVVVALIGTSAYFVSQHVRSDYVGTENAEAQFAAARQRLAGKSPLLELRGDDEPIIHRPPADAKAAPITVVRALLYSPDERKLVNLSLPAWLLRMGSGDRLRFIGDSDHFDTRHLGLTFADIERHGPGLILDGILEHRSLVLVWTE
jgi:hypothetical protein